MKKKPYISRAVKIACFLLALLLSVAFLQGYALRRLDHHTSRFKGYYRLPEGTVDVALIGASEVYTGFSSAHAYDAFGFTSYPYASESITAEGTLLALKEIVRTQKPKLVVIEPNAYLYKKDKNERHDAHIHKLVDNVPLSGNKLDYIRRNATGDEAYEYVFPLIKYHGMWTEYPKQGKKVLNSIEQDIRDAFYLKGFRTTIGKFLPSEKVLNDKLPAETKTEKLNPNYEKQLRELLDYCRSQQLNVVFMRTPHLVIKDTYGRFKRSCRAAEIVAEYGYDYLNLERDWETTGIDLHTDFYNYDHLNIYGTMKFTDCVCKILQTKYNIGRHVFSDGQDAVKTDWDTSASYFNKLYRYCDEQLQKIKEPTPIQEDPLRFDEDVETFRKIEDY